VGSKSSYVNLQINIKMSISMQKYINSHSKIGNLCKKIEFVEEGKNLYIKVESCTESEISCGKIKIHMETRNFM